MHTSKRGVSLFELLVVVGVIGVFALVLVLAFGGTGVDDATAIRAAETQGFTDARVIYKHDGFIQQYGCGEDDGTAFEMQAVNPAGKTVSFLVCCGGYATSKGCTIRTK